MLLWLKPSHAKGHGLRDFSVAVMIGVQRTGVTVAMGELKDRGFIKGDIAGLASKSHLALISEHECEV